MRLKVPKVDVMATRHMIKSSSMACAQSSRPLCQNQKATVNKSLRLCRSQRTCVHAKLVMLR